MTTALLFACDSAKEPEVSLIEQSFKSNRWLSSRLSISGEFSACERGSSCKTASKDDRQLVRYLSQRDLPIHYKGIAYLVTGSSSAGLAALEEALASEGDTPALWNDLSAGHLAYLERSSDWQALEAAIAAADKALELDATYTPAFFNRSLAFTKLKLFDLARSDLQSHQRFESSPAWREEAGALLSTLERTHTPVEGTNALGMYSRLIDSGAIWVLDDDLTETCLSEEYWAAARTLEKEYSDFLFGDALMLICNTQLSRVEKERITKLGHAIQAYQNLESHTAVQLINDFEDSTLHGSPASSVAIVQKAALDLVLTGELAPGLNLSTLSSMSVKYPRLAARGYQILGTTSFRSGEFESALEHYRVALDLLSEGLDPLGAIKLKSLSAEVLSRMGHDKRAWESGISALNSAWSLGDADEAISSSCDFLAIVAGELKLRHLQKYYATCASNYLKDSSLDLLFSVSALLSRAEANSQLGLESLALDDIAMAYANAKEISDSSERESAIRHIDLWSGANIRSLPRRIAYERLGRAWRYFNSVDNRMLQATSSLSLAQLDVESGETESAEQRLSEAVQYLNELRHSTRDSTNALRVSNHYRKAINQRIRLALSVSNPMLALETLEFYRAGHSTISVPRPTSQQANALTTGTLVLAWLDTEYVAWFFIEDTLTHTYSGRIESELIAKAATRSSIPHRGGSELALSKLYDALILPIRHELPDLDQLRIVPDGVFFGLPFSGLWDSEKQQFLIEQATVTISPIVRPAETKLNPIRSAAIFSAPNAEDLQALYKQETEPLALVALFPTGTSISFFQSSEASPERFLAALDSYDLVHFAGHGTVNRQNPMKSTLIFGNAVVTAEDLYKIELKTPSQTVVLASCDSSGYVAAMPEALALVRPLLEIGVANVVASLRPLEDREFSIFMLKFYENLGRGKAPAIALRETQLHFSSSGNVGNAWRYFHLYSSTQGQIAISSETNPARRTH